MRDVPYYAHVRESADGNKEYQTVAQHLTGTAELCRSFAAAFGAEADGELAGLAHDIGKCTDAFQDRLLNDGPIVDHATAGAMACAMRGNRYASACVAGHHGGLPDFGNMRTARKDDGTFYGRLLKGRDEQCLERCGESGVTLPPPTVSAAQKLDPLQASFWTRMLYSCLVDADYTASAMNDDNAYLAHAEDSCFDPLILLEKLYAYCRDIRQASTADKTLNRYRDQVFKQCGNTGDAPEGLYTLTAPTGTGKTLALLHFALRHCLKHGKKQIIIVLPFLTLAEQNADTYSKIIPNVLVDHSQGDLPEEARELAARWSAPVIITTSVRFF